MVVFVTRYVYVTCIIMYVYMCSYIMCVHVLVVSFVVCIYTRTTAEVVSFPDRFFPFLFVVVEKGSGRSP